MVPGSLLQVASRLLEFEERRIRRAGEPRRRGTIVPEVYADRKKHLCDFLDFMNRKHGQGAVARMRLEDLTMVDVEDFNRHIVVEGYSASQVAKRLQMVKALIDRAGRPENGLQRLGWNWDSRDVSHGKPTEKRRLPTLGQLKSILRACDARERALVWMGIGLGFGQKDLAEIRVSQIDAQGYDLRRGKTGIERYGETPPMVWSAVRRYLRAYDRKAGGLMFDTRRGLPLVHESGDSVQQWWHKLRNQIGESSESLEGFYILRHLGATEFGSRPGCSIGNMKRWLGHSASSQVADQYMKPVSPEDRPVVEWVRRALMTGRADLSEMGKKTAAGGRS
jgi:integrase